MLDRVCQGPNGDTGVATDRTTEVRPPGRGRQRRERPPDGW